MRLSARRRAAMIAAGALAVAGVAVPVGRRVRRDRLRRGLRHQRLARRVHRQRHHQEPRRPAQRLDARFDVPDRRPARHPGLVGQLVTPDRQPASPRPTCRGTATSRPAARPASASTAAGPAATRSPPSFTINGVTCGGAPQPTSRRRWTSRCRPARSRRPPTCRSPPPPSDPDGTVSKVEFYRNGLLVNTDTSRAVRVHPGGPAGRQLHRAGPGVRQRRTRTAHRPRRPFTVSRADRPDARRDPVVGERPRGRHRHRSTLRLSAAPTAQRRRSTLARTGDTDVTVAPATRRR